ncbi:NAD(P)-binding protein [Teratosphaeria nubilosa]|uniref:NAD(P)-binding protein n=1 Tax=Teratosphaeria nubilosa TaxID=161662 RepID=A0A6G1L5Q8_9PEZI|nr:NAD(P)-binding protein [Teratosphaeria nubilosa]
MSVSGKVAIVTGAGLGLGRLYALALANAGAKVVVNDYGGTLEGQPGSITRAQSVVNEITQAGGEAIGDANDISTQDGVRSLVKRAVDRFDTVHILINNAGITGKTSPHDDVDGPAFMRVLEISVLGTTLMTSACYSIMAKQKYGRVVNVSSNAIYGFGAGGDCAYGASKGATFAITRELGRWSERDGIKINCIMPSAASRMTFLSEGTKKVTETYFDPNGVVPFVVALVSDECPTSGEVYTASANRAARETLATFPGAKSDTAEGFLRQWDAVMGKGAAPYLADSTLDQVKYIVRQAHGMKMEDIAEFGIAAD